MATTPRTTGSPAAHERDASFTTLSGDPIAPLYTEADLPDPERIGLPGEYPFTRGVYPSMYRGRLWTMRQFAGFGTAEETNERFRYLLDHGQTGLSTAFDMPSLMGHDSDHARSLGEVGREGVAVDTLDDMQHAVPGHRPRRGHGLDDDQRAGRDHARLLRRRGRGGTASPPTGSGGTIQADILKEYIAQKEWCFPIDPAMRAAGRHDRVVLDADAALAPGLDLRLPHPRGRLDRRAGARVHAQGRADLRRAGGRARPRRRRLRAAAVLLLQRADRLLRGDRQVPRGAPDLGARAARHLRRQEPQEPADALPHADGGRLADRPAAAEQHRAHRDRGAGRRARRHPVAAHQLLRRGARAADRGRGARSRCAPSR